VTVAGVMLEAMTACAGATVVAGGVVSQIAKRDRTAVKPLDAWSETRAFIWVALAVFTISVFAQLLFIRMTHASFADFFSQPRRTDMFLMATSINLVNGFVAGYLASRAKNRERRWRVRQQEMTGYLNHHVRNALVSIQYAASCTKDDRVVNTCNKSIRRIVDALTTAERGIPQDDEFRTFQQPRKVS
jgi:hypothetical protein